MKKYLRFGLFITSSYCMTSLIILVFIVYLWYIVYLFILDSMEKPIKRKLRRRPNDPVPIPDKRRKPPPDILNISETEHITKNKGSSFMHL